MQLPTFYLDRFRQLYDFPGDSFPSARKLRLVFDNKQWTGPVVESPTLRRRTSSFVNFPFCPFRSDFFLRSRPSRAHEEKETSDR